MTAVRTSASRNVSSGTEYDADAMLRGAPDDATTRHLEVIAADIVGLLGPGVELIELAIEADVHGVVTLRARYGMAGETVESVGHGDSAIDAHARLRDAVVGDRVGLGLRVLVKPAGWSRS